MKTVSVLLIFIATICAVHAQSYTPIYKLQAPSYNANSALCCYIDWGSSGWLTQETIFPNEKLFSIKKNKYIEISSLVKKRPIVLQMGSITCPSYDLNIAPIKELEKKYKGKVDFYTVYVRENHPSDIYGTHSSFEQKLKFAKELSKSSKINQDILLDDVNGSFHQKLGNFGNSIYLIGTDMHVNHWSIFPSPSRLQMALESMVIAKGVGQKAVFVKGVDSHPLVSAEFSPDNKNKTIALMSKRSPSDSLENVMSKYSQFQSTEKEIYNEIPTDIYGRMVKMVEYQTGKDMNKKKISEIIKMTSDLQKDFRSEFKKRYEKWKKLNDIKDSTDASEFVLNE